MQQGAQNACRDFPSGLVDRHDPPCVQRGVALIVAGKNLKLGVHHGQPARVGIKFHLPEQSDLLPRREHIIEIRPVEPLAVQDRAGRYR